MPEPQKVKRLQLSLASFDRFAAANRPNSDIAHLATKIAGGCRLNLDSFRKLKSMWMRSVHGTAINDGWLGMSEGYINNLPNYFPEGILGLIVFIPRKCLQN